MRAYEKYAKVFDVKIPKRKDIEFKSKSGADFILKWNKNEYRVYKKMGGGVFDMHLGACVPDRLQKYVTERY